MLQKVSEETMRFMRGKYLLDEIGNGQCELKFRKSGKTVLTVYIRDDRYDFLLIYGKAERDNLFALLRYCLCLIFGLKDKNCTVTEMRSLKKPSKAAACANAAFLVFSIAHKVFTKFLSGLGYRDVF